MWKECDDGLLLQAAATVVVTTRVTYETETEFDESNESDANALVRAAVPATRKTENFILNV